MNNIENDLITILTTPKGFLVDFFPLERLASRKDCKIAYVQSINLPVSKEITIFP